MYKSVTTSDIRCTMLGVLMDANVLMTPVCLLHSFISDSTSRYYNLPSYTEF
jgi:hypothetical protein